jgi:hypothetical protein
VLAGGTSFWVDLNFIDTEAYSLRPIHKASEIEPLIRHTGKPVTQKRILTNLSPSDNVNVDEKAL